MEKKDGVFYYYLLLFALLLFHFDVCVSQDTSGFISIDCGSDTISSFYDLQYSTDAGFIDSGENRNISAESITPGTLQQLLNLRSFPVGQRNCYNLSVATGSKGNKYLIRASFLYGNYDGKNQQPTFDLHLGVEKWVKIDGDYYPEIIHVPTSNYVHVCLVNTGFGIPFISALELRPLNTRAYTRNSLQLFNRWYFANESSGIIMNLRSFPVGQRNCYNLSVATGSKGNKYLIRASFLYGNYDGKNLQPTFDLHLGVEKWDTIDGNYYVEIIHVPTSNYVYVCLVNTGTGIPFISALELRPLNPRAYSTNPQDSLQTVKRWYYAPLDSNQTIRYPNDIYDRHWSPLNTPSGWKELRTTSTVNNSVSYELPPPIVLQSAVTPINDSYISIEWSNQDANTRFSFSFHFSELEKLPPDEDREFDIYLNNVKLLIASVKLLDYLQIFSLYVDALDVRTNFTFSFQKSAGSGNPPVLSAVEMFKVRQFSQSHTNENDVFAVVNMKETYGLKKPNWQGDPCLPRDYMWEDIDCITDANNQSFSPRIKNLDLSSSGLSGEVTMYISNLTSLQSLDLSNNNLEGQIPDFLSEMTSLKFLDLTGNNFSRPIPQKLMDKDKNGRLSLRIEEDVQIKETRKKGLPLKLVSILGSLSLALILLILLVTFCKKRKVLKRRFRNATRRKDRSMSTEDTSANRRERKAGVENELRKFTYAEIKEMTKDFETPIGRGGFGEVFYGTMINGLQVIEVAVKRIYRETTDAYKDFIVEVNLLKYASHPNLTPFFGYCEDMHVMFVFQYMPNGSLNRFLSYGSQKDFTWRERINIALGAAQGLLYLHEECQYVHRDIKPENILLDENYDAKLADFGLLREIMEDETHVTTLIKGSPGYLDPEYFTNQQIRREGDVYSFGVVLLLLITGWPSALSMVGSQKKHVLEWIKNTPEKDDLRDIVDAKLNGNFDKTSAKKALKLAKACASTESACRPNMRKVVNELSKCLELAEAREQSQKLKYNNTSLDNIHSTLEISNDLTASVGHDSKVSRFSFNKG